MQYFERKIVVKYIYDSGDRDEYCSPDGVVGLKNNNICAFWMGIYARAAAMLLGETGPLEFSAVGPVPRSAVEQALAVIYYTVNRLEIVPQIEMNPQEDGRVLVVLSTGDPTISTKEHPHSYSARLSIRCGGLGSEYVDLSRSEFIYDRPINGNKGPPYGPTNHHLNYPLVSISADAKAESYFDQHLIWLLEAIKDALERNPGKGEMKLLSGRKILVL